MSKSMETCPGGVSDKGSCGWQEAGGPCMCVLPLAGCRRGGGELWQGLCMGGLGGLSRCAVVGGRRGWGSICEMACAAP